MFPMKKIEADCGNYCDRNTFCGGDCFCLIYFPISGAGGCFPLPFIKKMVEENLTYAKLILNAQRRVVEIIVLFILIQITNMASVLPLSLKQKTHTR
jgi:hypothetical protein